MKSLLTTGQAAKLLDVSADAVLKWIKSGRIPAQRTAGGHYRLRRVDVERLRTSSGDRRFRFCWEFHSREGKLPEECKECLVYVARAMRCYELAKPTRDEGHSKLYCKSTCEECDYFRMMQGKVANVLVVSDRKELTALLERQSFEATFNLAFAETGYSVSSLVESFRPDFAVIDCGMGTDKARGIAMHLVEDPRLQLVRIILAGTPDEYPSECDRPVFARIGRPFDLARISECISEILEAV